MSAVGWLEGRRGTQREEKVKKRGSRLTDEKPKHFFFYGKKIDFVLLSWVSHVLSTYCVPRVNKISSLNLVVV